jgi:hypothetical protein
MADEKKEEQVEVEDLETEGEDVKGGAFRKVAPKIGNTGANGINKLDRSSANVEQTIPRPKLDRSQH